MTSRGPVVVSSVLEFYSGLTSEPGAFIERKARGIQLRQSRPHWTQNLSSGREESDCERDSSSLTRYLARNLSLLSYLPMPDFW